eukprot:CAMPEP_0178397448 /NCGR_PEP_ID=MMETSP0689_2-20121128/14252_1 /TAXON_ID=160604 /ORGANISM="Amphidinium massartii, Strain CS-259" /LENGTH=1080 /DNA_ID=CAMNT_0020018159 /DNA_START=18 /DNA_END=3263 /DNA_ORIENTATION=-
MPISGLVGGAATAAALETGHALFEYNRANFRFDAGLRFERFMANRELAITQMNMYRNDVRKLTELVVTKTNMYTMVGTLILAVNIALFCAGRLGLHGQSPPGWIMGLFLTANAASLSFLSVTIWMCMHASMRASSASAHLLTRKVRLPVPTKRQMDKARKLSSDFEKQSWTDIFRIPFVTPHADAVPDPWQDEAGESPRLGSRARSVPASRRGRKPVPSWVREEWDTDRAGTVVGPSENLPKDIAPEHFRLYAKCMADWWPFDVYARVCLFLGVTNFIQALAFYGLGHINIELRSFWAAYSNPLLLAVAMALLINFDIRHPQHRREYLPPGLEYLGPVAVFPAAIGMSLEFRVEFSLAAIAFAWIFIFIAHGCQIVYVLKILDCVQPDERNSHPRVQETLGSTWWPEQWQVPSCFQHVLYLVAPPQRLQAGQVDLVRELREGDLDPTEANKSRASLQEEVTQLMGYLDLVFEWWQSEQVASQASTDGLRRVDQLYSQFMALRQAYGKDSWESLQKKLWEVRGALEDVRRTEGEPIASAGGAGELSDSSTGTAAGKDSVYGQSFTNTTGVDKKTDPEYRGYKTVEPWKLTSCMIIAWFSSYCVLVLGNFIEVFAGEQAFLTAPHWARPPMTRPSREPWEHGRPLGGSVYAGGMQWLPEHMEWYEHSRCDGEQAAIGVEVFYHQCKQTWRRRLEIQEHAMEKTWGRRNRTKAVQPAEGLSDSLQKLLSVLPTPDEASLLLNRNATKREAYQILDALAHFANKRDSIADDAAQLLASARTSKTVNVSWPSTFEPQMLACNSGDLAEKPQLAAITPKGTVALVSVQSPREAQVAEEVTLTGLDNFSPIMGASWTSSASVNGLMLVTRTGEILECPQQKGLSEWPCKQLPGAEGKIPLESNEKLLAAVAGRLSTQEAADSTTAVHVAVILEGSPELISIFAVEGEGEEAQWLPVGDLRLPESDGTGETPGFSISLAGKNELVVTSSSGSTFRRRLSDGEFTQWTWGKPVAKNIGSSQAGSYNAMEWQGACGLADSSQSVAHLSLRRNANALSRTPVPEVYLVGWTGNEAHGVTMPNEMKEDLHYM